MRTSWNFKSAEKLGSANSKITDPQITKEDWIPNRKSAHICVRSACLTNYLSPQICGVYYRFPTFDEHTYFVSVTVKCDNRREISYSGAEPRTCPVSAIFILAFLFLLWIHCTCCLSIKLNKYKSRDREVSHKVLFQTLFSFRA